jgi:hypothetical protein
LVVKDRKGEGLSAAVPAHSSSVEWGRYIDGIDPRIIPAFFSCFAASDLSRSTSAPNGAPTEFLV